MQFLQALHELMGNGSGYRFINTGSTDSLISYDLVSLKGNTVTTGGVTAQKTIHYSEADIWRKITIEIKDLAIVQYTTENPVTKELETIK